MDTSEIEQAMNKVLNDHRNISQEVHSDDHEFIAMLKGREKRRVELWQKFKTSFIGTLATSFVAMLIWIGTLVIEALKNSPPPSH